MQFGEVEAVQDERQERATAHCFAGPVGMSVVHLALAHSEGRHTFCEEVSGQCHLLLYKA